MSQITLTELHQRALREKWAMPHFNFSSLAQLNGILDAAKEMHAPLIVGVSEGERNFMGIKQVVYLVRSFRETLDIPIFLNADHSYTPASAIEAIDAGFDSVHIDLSKVSYKDNVEGTRRVVDYAKSKNTDVEVEGELGYLATQSSKIYKEEIKIPDDSYTDVEQALEYVKVTQVDRFAPAVGTIHGIAANEPHLRFDLAQDLRAALPESMVFVLHGGSGVTDEEMKKIVEVGFNNIHVSTELRIAYTEALRASLRENVDEMTPYKYLKSPRAAVARVVMNKLKLFNTVNRV